MFYKQMPVKIKGYGLAAGCQEFYRKIYGFFYSAAGNSYKEPHHMHSELRKIIRLQLSSNSLSYVTGALEALTQSRTLWIIAGFFFKFYL